MQLPVAFVNPLSALSTLYDFLKRAFPINFQYLVLPDICLNSGFLCILMLSR